MEYSTGALPPEDMAWQEGKTAGSISFVQTAEEMINLLQKRVAQVKSGDYQIADFMDMISITKMIQSYKED